MMEKMKEFLVKYKSVILYIIFGGGTTLVNMITYAICAKVILLGTVPSTILAWVGAVTFAYVTNRKWVFESRSAKLKEILREVIAFMSCRLLTGGLDLLMMYVFVDIIGINDILMKLFSNVIVIVLNYVASKLLIFKSGGPNEQKI